jgi:hypothetical protein
VDIVHTYTLHNKGPSDAKRTEVILTWPMLPLSGFQESNALLQSIDLPTIVRVSDPKTNNDICRVYHSVRETSMNVSPMLDDLQSFFDLPAGTSEHAQSNFILQSIRSTMTNNLVLREPSMIDPFQEALLPLLCHGSLCKTFICYIDTLPIGHSVLIQLKATLKYNQFQSVK